MRKILLLKLLSACLVVTGVNAPVAAEEMSNYELTQRIKELEKKAGATGVSDWGADRLAFSGLMEAEAGYENIDYADPARDDEDTSDAALATMELGVDAMINDHVSGRLLFLWEQDDTEPVDLDEGYITITSGNAFPLHFNAGRMYVPFGNFESNMVSDPLTLELAETRESAIRVGADLNGFYGSVYLFNGDIDEADEDSHLDNFGANAGYALQTDDFALDIGLGYVNNMLDSDGWGDDIEDTMKKKNFALDEYVAGLASHAIVSSGPIMFVAEYVTALDDPEFIPAAGGDGFRKEKVSAWNTELGYFFDLAGKPANAGISFQGSNNAGDFLPETRLMATVGVEIFEATNLALEYFHDEYEHNDEADVITSQLSVEF